jgi:alpha-tubulin suppressor-like RCC1 family protein
MSKCAVIVLGLALACTEFPNDPTKTVTVRPASATWTKEWFVRDSDTLVIEVRLPDSTSVTGLNIAWESSNPAVLDVTEVGDTVGTRGDSLTVQLRAKAVARTRGQAQVRVTVQGNGAFEPSTDTATIIVHERWLAISAGKAHTCAIASDSSAYCWGAGQQGELGSGRRVDSPLPLRVVGVGDLKFTSITAGEDNSCGLIIGTLPYCWGSGRDGRLGTNDVTQSTQFVPVAVSGGITFSRIVAGRTTCAITDDFKAFCWGDNRKRQLGVDAPIDSALDCSGQCSLRPRQVNTRSRTRPYVLIDAGVLHSCGITLIEVRCWGTGYNTPVTNQNIYLLGNDSIFQRDTAVLITGVTLAAIGVGGRHACGLTQVGEVRCWGRNDKGQLGSASNADSPSPVTVIGVNGFSGVSVGQDHSCALAPNGTAVCWGSNSSGQLGDTVVTQCATVDDTGIPISVSCRTSPITVFGGLSFTLLSAGWNHTCGITTRGAAFCWGAGGSGRLGNSFAVTSNRPMRVVEP